MISLPNPLILASQSKARQEMLRNVGLEFQSIPADLDEPALIQTLDQTQPVSIALELAKAKALAVSKEHKEAYVIGSDQILELDGTIFSKAKTKDDAREKLQTLKGKTHRLISAVALAQNGEIIWDHTATAHLTMHAFNDEFLKEYLQKTPEDILYGCVGAYALEAQGAWLFEDIQGDYFTILGMPLLPLLSELKSITSSTRS